MDIENSVTGKTQLMGLIGNPVEHSISPQFHNTLLRHFGIDSVYVPFKVEKNQLEAAIEGFRSFSTIGFNVTIPFKEDVMPLLDEVSRDARLIGAVNTVKNINGKLYGYNTDAEGFSRAFREESGTGFAGKRVVILGAGGAARAIAVRIASEDASKITVVNRTLSKASDIVGLVNGNFGNIAEYYGYEDSYAHDAYSQSDIIINTTSIGMYPHIEKSPLDETVKFTGRQIIYDIIYNPAKTKLLSSAEKDGAKVINGLGMLLYQGILAYEIWTGITLDSETIKDIFDSFENYLK